MKKIYLLKTSTGEVICAFGSYSAAEKACLFYGRYSILCPEISSVEYFLNVPYWMNDKAIEDE